MPVIWVHPKETRSLAKMNQKKPYLHNNLFLGNVYASFALIIERDHGKRKRIETSRIIFKPRGHSTARATLGAQEMR